MPDEHERLKAVTKETARLLFGDPAQASPDAGPSAYALWKEFDPELAKHLSMFFTGRLYARQVIDHKQRELCAVAALTVLDKPAELRAHISAALNVGATREEVAEVIFQMCTNGGVPCMVEGLRSLKTVLETRDSSGD